MWDRGNHIYAVCSNAIQYTLVQCKFYAKYAFPLAVCGDTIQCTLVLCTFYA